MADKLSNTKAAFDENWACATEVGEYLTQSNGGDWIHALAFIQEALIGGCPAMLEWDQGGQKMHAAVASEFVLKFWSPPDRLRWVSALNPSFQRINFRDRPWPWEVRAYLSLSDLWELRHIEGLPAMPRVILHRAEAIKWGLLPALKSLQVAVSKESPLPDGQLNDPAIGMQAVVRDQNAPEQQGAPPPLAAQSDEPASVDSTSATSVESPGALNRGGRPTNREKIIAEARRRLSAEDAKENVPRDLAVFCRILRNWLECQPNPIRNSKTGEVMSVDTIEEHVRDMFWEFWDRPENR